MNIHYANLLANELYGVEVSDSKFEEIALLAHNKIGNKECKLYRYIAKPNEKGYIELPCNCDLLEAVSTLWKDWNHVTNKDDNGDWDSQYIEHWIESLSEFKDPLYVPGKYVKYELIGNKLYVPEKYGPLYILYKGEVLDEDGLPEVSEKEADAIAAFIAYWVKYKEGIKTMNPNIVNIALQLYQMWILKCDLARSSSHIFTLNEWNEVLDVKSSWDRHQHGKSYRMIH